MRLTFGKLRLLFAPLAAALAARRQKKTVAGAGVIGLRGKAETEIAPEGAVFVRGELWPARSRHRIERGQSVRVVGIAGLALDVDAYEETRQD